MQANALKKLRLEALENRELLSATTWNAPSEAYEPVAVATAATLDSAPIDLTAFSAETVETAAEAATWVVTSNLDDGSEGTLRYAIENAADGDTITFAESMRDQTIVLEQGALEITKSLTISAYDLFHFEQLEGLIHDTDATAVTIDAQKHSRVFNLRAGADLTLLGLHITNGSALDIEADDNHDNVADVHGGALHVPADSTMRLEACVVSNSHAELGGGAVAVSGDFYASNTIFENNDGGADEGGAIRIFDGFAEVTDCYFRGNKIVPVESEGSTDYKTGGGGAVGATGGVFRSFNTSYRNNSAWYGAAFFVSGGDVYMSNSIVVDNGGPGVYGDFTGCYHGGGIDVDAGSLTIVNSTIAHNVASTGGGLYLNTDAGNLTVNIYNSIIAENSAEGSLFGETRAADVLLNSAYSRTAVVNGYNTLSTFSNWTNRRVSGVTNYTYNSRNSLFADLEEHDIRLAEDSVARDKGNNAYAVDYYGREIEFDFIRNYRVIGDAIDLGALEYGSRPYYEDIDAPQNVVGRNYNGVDQTIEIVWDDMSDNELGFRVEISTDGENWIFAAQTEANAESATVGNIAPNETYYVRVRAEKDMTNVSEWGTGSFETEVVYLDAPGLDVDCVDWHTLGVTIDCVEGVTDYVLQFATDANFENVVRELKTTSETDVWPNDRYRNIDGFTENTTYYVRAKSVGTGGAFDSGWSNVASATTDKIYLATPTLTVAPKTGDSLALNVGYVSYADSYTVEYSTDPNFANASTLTYVYSGPKTIYNLEEGTTYYVRVKATSASEGRVDSAWNVGSATTYSTEIELAQPTLTASARSATALNATIGYVSHADEYVLEYSTDPNFGAAATQTLVRPYNGPAKVEGLQPETTYYLRVKGVSHIYGDSPYSETIVATTNAAPTVELATPTLTAEPRALWALTLNVGYVSYAETYVVEYSTDPSFPANGTQTLVRESSGPAKIDGLPSGATIYVRAKATNATYGDSDWSTTAVATTNEIAAPTLTAQPRSASSIALNLGYVSGASYYVVEYATSADFADARTVANDSNGPTRVEGLPANSAYYLRAYAVDANGGFSDYSEVVLATTMELAVPTLALAPRTADALSATLGYVSGAATYEIEYSTSADFANAQTLVRPYNGPAKLAGLTTGATYFVRARAVDSFGVASAWSDVVSATVEASTASAAVLVSEAFADLAFEDAFEDDEWNFFA